MIRSQPSPAVRRSVSNIFRSGATASTRETAMSDRRRTSSPWLACAITVAGLGLLFAPANATEPWRILVRDVIQPGQVLLCAVIEWSQSVIPMRRETARGDRASDDELRVMELR